MADESEAARRRAPAPPPRQASRPPEPRPRTQPRLALPAPPRPAAPDLPAPPRLIRPSEHLAIVERAMERRPLPLVPTITVLHGPRPALPPPPPVHRSVLPPPMRMPAPVPHPVLRLPQPRRDVQPQQTAVVPLALPAPASAPAPPAAFGAAPRTIVIQRPDARHGFGFTLRHLVVYPPDSLQDLYEDARHLAVGAVGAPMDTIFVRSVRAGGPAAAAGLRAGDRVLAVNGEPVAGGRARAPYARVVQLAQREPRTLRLTVVPRDHDLLQRYFSEAAYNPESNQRQLEMPAVSEHESRLFDVYRRALPAPAARRDAADYAVSLAPPHRCDARLAAHHYMLHDSRRESDTSLPSSAAESKDSLGSFDSNSTLTGRELDDSIILSRIRKSLEQKEAFLRRPSQPTGWVTPEAPPAIKQKEFYARPQKLQKPAWPPPAASPPLAATPPPIQQNQDKKEECSASVDSGTFSGYGEVNGTQTDKSRSKQDKSQFVSTLSKIQETAPSSQNTNGTNGAIVTNGTDKEETNSNNLDNRYPVPELQLVTARTRQLEEARGGGRRTETARSELARLSAARLEPSVALRRREFEARALRREARSLDVHAHTELENDATPIGGSLSGNQLMITGSKHLHCPPPDGYVPETEKVQMRTRSNSTGSEGLPIRRQHASDGSHAKRRMGLNREQMEALDRVPVGGAPARPTHLSLAPAPPAPPSPATPADSGFSDDIVTRRQKKDAQLGEEERAMRRVSYLKATWGDRLHLDTDVEPDPDHALRSMHRKWRPPRFADDITPLLRIFDPHAVLPTRSEKKGDESLEPLPSEGDIQGNVQIKMVVSNGKRASDRSWKQVWAMLNGTKLYLYRHNPSQSPGGAGGAGDAQSGSRDALDVRYSLAALADDYTKRKHVVRVTTAAGAELLLQADGAADAQRWLAALRRHSAEPPPEASPAPDAPAQAPATAASDSSSPLPPQRSKKIGRNRSPTVAAAAGPVTPTLPSSPKNKTWKVRMAKQLRRMQGGGGAAPPAGWLGAPLARCPADPRHPLVPLAVTLPAHAVEAYGLRTVGVYRVPGNAAGVAALAAALDRGEPPPPGDARWADVHVASSLLKAYLRRLPDPLLTAHLYPAFIAADRSEARARELRRLVRALPVAHRATLRYLVRHLRRVAAHHAHNKMEARNLAIVFGPTLVRAAPDDMLALVNDMSSQCRIIESFLTHYEWYFEEEEGEPPAEPPADAAELSPAPAPSRDLLIHNVKKIEGKDVSTRDIVSSIISAANRKIQRKPRAKPDKKWADKHASPPASPPAALHHDSIHKIEIESMTTLNRGRHDTFTIDGAGDLVSSLTNTFDQKLRTLNNSSPLDDGSIPYADECQDGDEEGDGDKSGSSPSSGASPGASPGAPPGGRARDLKAAWLARDLRRSSSSDETDRVWPAPLPLPAPARPWAARDDTDDSEKENTAARAESASRSPSPAAVPAAPPAAAPAEGREPARVLRSESLNCRQLEWAARRRDPPGWRSTKLKRKNGMPERGIKRRHTVGGTKDFDKDGWSARHTRTSSPDLSAAWPPPLESHV